MLTDAHKPLRGAGPRRYPIPKGAPMSVDMRMKKAVQRSQGQRLANARDRTSIYAMSQDPNLTEHEKEEMRKVLHDRFSSGARPMPGTVQGLTALANQQIEDAMARGQFKNIARGRGKNIERDYTASSPFLDTTEYFMNKIIQKQEVVPPWIEKQQDLVKAADTFRRRLRADWKRHAARMIASKGGSLEVQVQRARAYATAEAASNPRATKSQVTRGIDEDGRISQAKAAAISSYPPSSSQDQTRKPPESESPGPPSSSALLPSSPSPAKPITPPTVNSPESLSSQQEKSSISHPFRDPAWESLELPYQTLAITSLNNLTRSYNLQAPDLAKKPYFSLARELQACFAEVAPQLPEEILARARAPQAKKGVETGIGTGRGVLERWQGGSVKVHDSTRPNYGLRELWRDFWGQKGS